MLDMLHEYTTHYPYRQGYKFAIALTTSDERSVEIDDQIMNLQLYQSLYSYDENGNYVYSSTPLSFVEWSSDFPVSSQLRTPGNVYEYLYCPNTTELALKGNFQNDEFYFIWSTFGECTSNWKNQSEIDSVFNDLFITILSTNSYVDFNDFVTPIKTKMYANFYFKIDREFQKQQNLFLKLNQAKFKDSAMHIDDLKSDIFWSLGTQQSDFSMSGAKKVYFQFSIQKDSMLVKHKRYTFTLLDIIARIGGVYEILSMLVGLIWYEVSKKMYVYEMIQSLYYKTTPQKQKSSGLSMNININSPKFSEKVYPKKWLKDDVANVHEEIKKNSTKEHSNFLFSENIDYSDEPKHSETPNSSKSDLIKNMQSWNKYKFTFSEIVSYSMNSLNFLLCSSCKSK